MKKVIVVMGSGISSLGKGIFAASIAKLLQDQGYNIINKKVDPYIQCADTLSPTQHGEVYVTDDGSTIDQDFGSYYRFAEQNLTKNESLTSGTMFSDMLQKEKNGEFLGQTVQLSPHYTNYVNEKILNVNDDVDIIVEEIGGIINDAEANTFIESARKLKRKLGAENVCYVLLAYVPYIHPTNEMKTKLCQTGVKQLRSFGIEPDFLICRTEKKLTNDIKKKIATMCDIDEDSVIEGIDVNNIYEVPVKFKEQNVDIKICKHFNINYKPNDLHKWKNLLKNVSNFKYEKTVAIVGKYITNPDAYASVVESLKIAGNHQSIKINIKWIDSENVEKLDKDNEDFGSVLFDDVDGIVIPGGFGVRGIQGMILAARFCREHNIPTLGICLGMQIMSIEFARNVLKYNDATSEEFDINNISNNHVITLMDDQKDIIEKSNTMRLGSYKCNIINKPSKFYDAYKKDLVNRRHRHRYEFNNKYEQQFIDNKMKVVGKNLDRDLVEAIELEDHPFYIGVQYHPEFNSTFTRPEEIFNKLIESLN